MNASAFVLALIMAKLSGARVSDLRRGDFTFCDEAEKPTLLPGYVQ